VWQQVKNQSISPWKLLQRGCLINLTAL
jgi:hypothetical protein